MEKIIRHVFARADDFVHVDERKFVAVSFADTRNDFIQSNDLISDLRATRIYVAEKINLRRVYQNDFGFSRNFRGDPQKILFKPFWRYVMSLVKMLLQPRALLSTFGRLFFRNVYDTSVFVFSLRAQNNPQIRILLVRMDFVNHVVMKRENHIIPPLVKNFRLEDVVARVVIKMPATKIFLLVRHIIL